MMNQGLLETLLNVMLQLVKKIKYFLQQKLSDAIHRQTPKDARSRVAVISRRYIHLLTFTSRLERCFLNTRRGLVKFPAANYVTFASQVESGRISRPFPDYQSPGFHYPPVDMTATVDRTVDNY